MYTFNLALYKILDKNIFHDWKLIERLDNTWHKEG